MVDKKYVLLLPEDIKYANWFISILNMRKVLCRNISSNQYHDKDLMSSRVMIQLSRDLVPEQKKHREFLLFGYKNPVKFSKDNLCSSLRGLSFAKNYIFYGTFRDELQKFREFGIIEKFIFNRISKLNMYKDPNDEEPPLMVEYERRKLEKLTWSHLYAGFYLWIAACAISTIVFICEVISHFFLKFRLIYFLRSSFGKFSASYLHSYLRSLVIRFLTFLKEVRK